jgi:uncharacterized RDD family membrane protein YckC
MKRQRHFKTNLFKRTFAMLIDYVPILLVAVFIGKEFFDKSPFPASDSTIPLAERMESLQAFAVTMLAVNLIWFTYGTLAEASSARATFGKRLFGLSVCDLTGGRLSFSQTLIRNFSKILSLLPFGLGFLSPIFAFNNRAWHDMLAKAVVVENRN